MFSSKKSGYPAQTLIKITLLLILVFSLSAPFTVAKSQSDECNATRENTPNAAMPYVFQGMIAALAGDSVDAIDFYTRAIESGFRPALIYYLRGDAYADIFLFEYAEPDLTCAIALAPDTVELYLRRGEIYHNSQRYDLAVADFDRAVELAPDRAHGYFGRGLASLFNGDDPESALPDLNRAIELNPTHRDAYYVRGSINLSTQNYSNAVDDYSQAITLSNGEIADYFALRAYAYDLLEDYPSAIEDYKSAALIQPDNTRYLTALTRALAQQGAYSQAMLYVERVLAIDEYDAYAYRLRSGIYVQRNDLDSAIDDMNFALDLDPYNLEYYQFRAQLHRNQSNFPLAIADLNEVLAQGTTDNIDALLMRGDTYFRVENYEAAIEDYTQILEIDPENTGALFNRAVNAMQLYDAAMASSDFNALLTAAPENNRLHAVLYTALHDYEPALVHINQMIELSPENALLYCSRAGIYVRLGEFELASADLDRFVELSGTDIESYYASRASFYELQEQHELALTDIEAALQAHPDNAIFVALRGRIYRNLGEAELANADLQQALAMDGRNTIALEELADSAFEQGNFEQALDFYEALRRISYLNIEIYAKIAQVYEALDQPDEARLAYQLYVTLLRENADPEIVEQAEALGVTLPE